MKQTAHDMTPASNHRKNWRIGLLLIGCLISFCVFFQICYDWMLQGSILPKINWADFVSSIVLNLIPISVISLVAGGIVWKTRLLSPLILKLGVDLFVTLSVVFVVNVLFSLITGLTVNWGGTVFCFTLVLLILETLTYFRRLQLTLHHDQIQQRELMHKHYELIKMKVNPHFLYNAFNQLYAILAIAPERGQHYVLSLSRYYRYLMNVGERETVSLVEEQKYLADYIDLMKQRFDDCIQVNIVGTPPATAEIIPLSLQTLLENVAKHNIINEKHPMVVTITFLAQGCRVMNPVCPRISDGRSGFGLDYLKQEYQQYGKHVVVESDDHQFSVYIPYIAL